MSQVDSHSDSDPLIGQVLADKYKVISILGRGGFGTVYLVEITAGMVGEKLALKIIPEELSREEKIRNRFINEIRVAMKLVNKYIIQVRDVGMTEEGQLYYTMDYSPGKTLSEILKEEGKLQITRSIMLIMRVLRALYTAHDSGVIHRDLKPGNVMVEGQEGKETARLLDFGIATAVEGQTLKKGKFLGSPLYMPPEQFLGEKLGVYTDLYSVGVMLYECVTGKKPYTGKTAQEIYNDIKSRVPQRPSELNSDILQFPGLDDLIMKALERNPDNRFQAAREFFQALNEVMTQAKEKAMAKKSEAKPQANRGGSSQAAKAPRRRNGNASRAWKKKSQSPVGMVAAATILVGGIVGLLLFKDAIFGGGGKTGVSDDPIDKPIVNPVKKEPTKSPLVNQTTKKSGDELDLSKDDELTPEKKAKLKALKEKKALEYLAEARTYRITEDWKSLREQCVEAIELNNMLAEAHLLKGIAEFHEKFWAQAEVSLETAFALYSSDEKASKDIPVDLFLYLAKMSTREGQEDPSTAEMYLEKALEVDPKNLEATESLISILDADEQEEFIKTAILRAKKEQIKSEVVDAMHQKYFVDLPKQRALALEKLRTEVAEAFEAKDYAVVVEKAPELLLKEPSHETSMKYAQSLRYVGEFQKSLSAFKEITLEAREVPGLFDNNFLLGELAFEFGITWLALFEETQSDSKDLENARINLNSAVNLLDEERGKKHLKAKAYTYLARCAVYDRSPSKLIEAIKFADNNTTRDSSLLFHQAESFYKISDHISDPDERFTMLGKAINKFIYSTEDKSRAGIQIGEGYYMAGRCYYERGKKDKAEYKKARQRFAQARKSGFETPELYQYWGHAFSKAGDLKEAADKFRESYNLRPNEKICLLAARYYLEKKFNKLADAMLQQGLRDFPESKRLRELIPLVNN